ncbi:hypothetical protein NPIL_74451 [Nephila pilipes]|uniref:Uncharacterized protein n=1 Tax=Nephila pilipes TaxID=299642 RepID=A0A8X6U814_NEPPI|nr:hypothetical protein NPIL_74451 [Nephila pilipes]
MIPLAHGIILTLYVDILALCVAIEVEPSFIKLLNVVGNKSAKPNTKLQSFSLIIWTQFLHGLDMCSRYWVWSEQGKGETLRGDKLRNRANPRLLRSSVGGGNSGQKGSTGGRGQERGNIEQARDVARHVIIREEEEKSSRVIDGRGRGKGRVDGRDFLLGRKDGWSARVCGGGGRGTCINCFHVIPRQSGIRRTSIEGKSSARSGGNVCVKLMEMDCLKMRV